MHYFDYLSHHRIFLYFGCFTKLCDKCFFSPQNYLLNDLCLHVFKSFGFFNSLIFNFYDMPAKLCFYFGLPFAYSVGLKLINSQQLYKNCTYIKIPPNMNSNTHFRPPGYPVGGQNLKMALSGGYFEDRIWVFWNFCPIFGHLTLFQWSKFKILTQVVYHTPLVKLEIGHSCKQRNL